MTVEAPATSDTAGGGQDERRKLGEPWKFNDRAALYEKVIDRLDEAGIKTTSAAIGVERIARPSVLLEIEAAAVR